MKIVLGTLDVNKIVNRIIIISLCTIIILQRECDCNHHMGTGRTIIDEYDSVKQMPKPTSSIQLVYVDTGRNYGIPYPVAQKIDTMDLVKKYFSSYTYQQTFADSDEKITLRAETSKNQIHFEQPVYQWLRPIRTGISMSKNSNKIFVGGFFELNQASIRSFGIESELITKSDHLYGIGFDALNRGVMLKMLFKIRLKKQ